jgi:hypothetical protein
MRRPIVVAAERLAGDGLPVAELAVASGLVPSKAEAGGWSRRRAVPQQPPSRLRRRR